MTEQIEPTPLLTVGTIIQAFDALKQALFLEMEAQVASLESSLDDKAYRQVEVVRYRAEYATRMAQCDVDKNKTLMEYFQTAALNNLKNE